MPSCPAKSFSHIHTGVSFGCTRKKEMKTPCSHCLEIWHLHSCVLGNPKVWRLLCIRLVMISWMDLSFHFILHHQPMINYTRPQIANGLLGTVATNFLRHVELGRRFRCICTLSVSLCLYFLCFSPSAPKNLRAEGAPHVLFWDCSMTCFTQN